MMSSVSLLHDVISFPPADPLPNDDRDTPYFTIGDKNAKKVRDLRLSVKVNGVCPTKYLISSAFYKSTKTHLSGII